MKKRILALICILGLSVFTGCGNGESSGGADVSKVDTSDPKSILMFQNKETGDVIQIGDSKEQVEKITGGDEHTPTDFVDTGVFSTSYVGHEELQVNYLDNVVVAISVYGDKGNWEPTNGVYLGMPIKDAEEKFKDNTLKGKGLSGGILFSYDESLQQVEIDPDSFYRVTISFDEGSKSYVEYVSVEKNLVIDDDAQVEDPAEFESGAEQEQQEDQPEQSEQSEQEEEVSSEEESSEESAA